ncbi:MAG: hypothetical protein ACKO58_02765 [Cyanobium sp.]
MATVAILCLFTPERAQASLLTINVQDCRESIGIHTVPRSDVMAHLPTDFSTRFGFGGFGSAPGADQAQLIARTMRCAIATVAGSQLGPLTTSHYGVITARTDAQVLAGSPLNGIDNWQLGYTTSSSTLAALLNNAGMVALEAPALTFTYDDPSGSFASTNSPLFTTSGNHLPPDVPYPGGFIAHWWGDGPKGEVLSRQVIPEIAFRFTGAVTLTPAPGTLLETILQAQPVAMDVPLGGAFAYGLTQIESVPAPLPLLAAPMLLGWSRRLRASCRAPTNPHPLRPMGLGCGNDFSEKG